MSNKVKIQNSTGDWKCQKCGCLNTELKENIKKIDKVLCRSCFSEFDIDKENNKHFENKVVSMIKYMTEYFTENDPNEEHGWSKEDIEIWNMIKTKNFKVVFEED